MLVVVDGVVVLRVKLLTLIGVPVADDVAQAPLAMLLYDVLLKHLAWFIDDEMGGDVDDGLQHIPDDFDGLAGGNRQFYYLGHQLVVPVVLVGDVRVIRPVEQLVHFLLD